MKLFKTINKRIMCLLAALLIVGVALLTVPVPVAAEEDKNVWPGPPQINAGAAILMDMTTGTILYSKNPQEKMYPASTTKIMSTLLAIEQCPLSDIVTMSYDAIHTVGWDSSRIGVVQGEELTMEQCLYSILLASANEVCYAVGEHVADGDITEFVKMMNQRAKDLGCVNTHFTNPHGLHDSSHYTCAYDLALIMKKCVEYTTFCRISNNYYYELPATNKTNQKRVLAQTHQILRKKIKYQGVYAGKTGHTDEAGNCLVTTAERDGLNLVCVVLGEKVSDDCYKDTMTLFDYGFNNFHMVNYGGASSDDAVSAFPGLFDEKSAFESKSEMVLSLSEAKIVAPKEADLSLVTNNCRLYQLIRIVKGKNIIGRAEFYYHGIKVGETDIIYTSETEEILDKAADYYEKYYGTDDFSEETYQKLQGILPADPEEQKDLRPTIIGITVAILVFIFGIVAVIRLLSRRM